MASIVHHDGDSQGETSPSRIRLRRSIVILCVSGLIMGIAILLLVLRQRNLYSVVILPSCGGQPFSPHAVNDRGQIVGLVASPTGGYIVALWDRQHGVQELGLASKGPLAINNSGQVAGTIIDANSNTSAFLWSDDVGVIRLRQGEAKNSGAYAINNNAQIVGSYQANDGTPRACLWADDATLRDLNPPAAHASLAYRISDSGQILGAYGDGPDGRSCFWDLNNPGSSAWMPVPDDVNACHDMNNRGYVLADMIRPDDRPGEFPQKYVVLWHKGRDLKWLFALSGIDAASCRINDANQVVYSETHRSFLTKYFSRHSPPRERLFLWDPIHGSVSLDKGLQLEATDRFVVRDLSNEGHIVGVVLSNQDVVKRAVFLDPITRKWRKRS